MPSRADIASFDQFDVESNQWLLNAINLNEINYSAGEFKKYSTVLRSLRCHLENSSKNVVNFQFPNPQGKKFSLIINRLECTQNKKVDFR